MSYTMNLGAWNGIFAVPCDLVDRQLRLAGEAQIKVLLYILRHSGRCIELHELAHACGLGEGDTTDAVAYWQQEGLIVCKGDRLSVPETAPQSQSAPVICHEPEEPESVSASAPLNAPAPAQPVSPPESPAAEAEAKPRAKERIRYSYDECAQMMNSDSELRQMLPVLSGILCKNLNHTEISVFITLVKWYGLPPACVAMLVEYCREIGRPTIAYIEATGVGWVGEDILTIEQVDRKIARLRSARTAWTRIRTLLDLPERAPTKKEQEYASTWNDDWHMPDELIQLAYERCVDSKGKLVMSYMNGILSNWHRNGITTAEQAAAESASAAKPAASPPAKPAGGAGMYAATYDREDIEAMLDDDWMDDA